MMNDRGNDRDGGNDRDKLTSASLAFTIKGDGAPINRIIIRGRHILSAALVVDGTRVSLINFDEDGQMTNKSRDERPANVSVDYAQLPEALRANVPAHYLDFFGQPEGKTFSGPGPFHIQLIPGCSVVCMVKYLTDPLSRDQSALPSLMFGYGGPMPDIRAPYIDSATVYTDSGPIQVELRYAGPSSFYTRETGRY
jgi:hypothetical protein